jgi:hypothetical protein
MEFITPNLNQGFGSFRKNMKVVSYVSLAVKNNLSKEIILHLLEKKGKIKIK